MNTAQRQTEQQAEAWLSARIASMQPGEEIYLAPQIRVGNQQHLVGTHALAQRLRLEPGSGPNRWRKK